MVLIAQNKSPLEPATRSGSVLGGGYWKLLFIMSGQLKLLLNFKSLNELKFLFIKEIGSPRPLDQSIFTRNAGELNLLLWETVRVKLLRSPTVEKGNMPLLPE